MKTCFFKVMMVPFYMMMVFLCEDGAFLYVDGAFLCGMGFYVMVLLIWRCFLCEGSHSKLLKTEFNSYHREIL